MSRVRRLATKPFVVMPLVAVLVLGGWALWQSRTTEDVVDAIDTESRAAERERE